MLIVDGKLDIEEFKLRFKEFDWIKCPRVLNQDNKDYFYITSYEDENWKIQIKTRPSMYMSVTETYKHCDERGNKVPSDYKKRKYDFGHYVEVKVTENTINQIKSIAKELDSNKVQEVDL